METRSGSTATTTADPFGASPAFAEESVISVPSTLSALGHALPRAIGRALHASALPPDGRDAGVERVSASRRGRRSGSILHAFAKRYPLTSNSSAPIAA